MSINLEKFRMVTSLLAKDNNGRDHTAAGMFREMPSLLSIIRPGRMVIGPDLAQRILAEANYERQRPIYKGSVAVAVEHIRRGTWIDGYQIWFVLVDGRLHLTDGQHRLTALIETGRELAFTVEIVAGQSAEDVHRLYHRQDRIGRRRTDNEMLTSAGVAADQGISKLMSIAAFKAAPMLADGFASVKYRGAGGPLPLDDDKLDFLMPWWPTIRRYDSLIGKAPTDLKRALMNAGIVAVAALTLKHQPASASDFWNGVAMNDGLRRNDPRHTLVGALQNRAFSRVGGEGAKVAAVAWNAHFSGRTISFIRVGDATEVRLLGVPKTKVA